MAALKLHWDRGSDLEEWAQGADWGRRTIEYFSDRGELLSVLDGLNWGSVEFVRRLQRASFIRPEDGADAPLEEFAAYMFGGAGGGVFGPFGQAFISEFERLRPFVQSMH